MIMEVFIDKGNGLYRRITCYNEAEYECLKTNLTFDRKPFFAVPWVKGDEYTAKDLNPANWEQGE